MCVAVFDELESTAAYAREVERRGRMAGHSAVDALRAPSVLGDPADVTALFPEAGPAPGTIETRTGTARFCDLQALRAIIPSGAIGRRRHRDGTQRIGDPRGGEGMNTTIRGSCLCGAVRYELTEMAEWSHCCHCSRCRKATGAAFASNLFVPLEALRYVEGEQHLRSFRPAGAERFTHTFCVICGSTLPFRNEARGRAVVPMGTLDENPGLAPRAHIFVASKAPWLTITDTLPRHPDALGTGGTAAEVER